VSTSELQFRRRSAWQHFSIQSAPLLLAFVIFVGTTVAYIALFQAKLGRTPGSFEWTSVTNSALPLVFAAVGQTVVVVTRGLDLSVGGMMDLTNAMTASHMHAGTGSMIAWTLLALAIGAGGGLINGLLVAFGRLQPILVTLATLSVFQGLAIKVLPEPGGAIPLTYTKLLTNPNQPYGLGWVGFVFVLWFLFRRTRLGVNIYAIGNDAAAARARGISLVRTRIGAYVLSGIFAAAAGLFLAATTTAGDATSADVFVLRSIAAVVLGGISFYGGRGSAIGCIAGAFTLTLLVNVLFQAGINPLYQEFYEGVFLVVAVVLGALVGRLVRVRA
jgi:ribose transport system permease protein